MAVIQVGIVAALAADDLKCAGVAAFWLAVHDADWPAPQNGRPAVPGLIQAFTPAPCDHLAGYFPTLRRLLATRQGQTSWPVVSVSFAVPDAGKRTRRAPYIAADRSPNLRTFGPKVTFGRG